MPASLSRVALFLGALLGARAARMKMNKTLSFLETSVRKAGGTSSEVICGGDGIWNILTASSTVMGIQNIKWTKMDNIADDFLAQVEGQKKGLEVEIEQLLERIKEKKAQEEPVKTTEDELMNLLEESLAGFGGSAKAAEMQCGQPSARPRPPRNAFRESKKAWAENADKFLDVTKRFDGELFLGLCAKTLPHTDGSYCGPLCQQLKDKAQAISNARAGDVGGLGSDELMMILKTKQEKLSIVEKDIHRCEHAQETLGAFRSQVGELKGVQTVRQDELQKAEYALDDALYDLEDLTVDLENEEAALLQAEEALAQEGDKTEGVRQDLAQVREQEAGVRTELTAGLKKLDKVRKELEAAKDATKKALDMKAALSSVMLMMRLFFDYSVLEPLRGMGIDENLKLEKIFGESDKVAATNALGVAVDKLGDYCETKAKEAFGAVKDSVDLSPLCGIGEPGAFKSETLSAVTVKEEMFAHVLAEDVFGWFDPYHNNHGMTKEMAAQRVAEGETAGFQEIVGVYSGTKFFKYLREWRKGGEIPAVLLSLETLTGDLSKAVQEAEKFVQGLQDKLADVEQKRNKVIGDLEAAERELAKAGNEQTQLITAVQELKGQTTNLEDKIEHLREQVRIAKENCKKADQALIDALEAVKSGWGQSNGLLEELRSEELQAEKKVLIARKAVAKSQTRLLAAQSHAH